MQFWNILLTPPRFGPYLEHKFIHAEGRKEVLTFYVVLVPTIYQTSFFDDFSE